MSVVQRGYKGRHIWRTPQSRKVARGAALGAAVVGLIASTLSTPATAAVDETCATPIMREAMVSQGLPSDATLARGKTTLVKYFLSMPAASSSGAPCDPNKQYLTVTGGTLAVSNSLSPTTTTSVSLPAESFGPITPYVAAPSTASTGNPAFLVKGPQLGPTGDGAPYSVVFTGTITYTVTDATGITPVTSAPRSLTVASVSRTVDVPANPMRILVVPIGDERRSFDTNFPIAARNLLAAGMNTLGRLLPVADGVGTLSDATAGIRYTVALSDQLVDIGPHDHDFNPSTPDVNWLDGDGGLTSKYCPSPGHFPYLSAKLATARSKWNSIPENPPASRVLGVLWQDISRGISTDGGCIEGYADIAGTVAWSRLVAPLPGQVATSAGSLAGMELMHTLGAVPNSTQSYHSKNSQADGTATDRAYDVPRRSVILNDKALMAYQPPNWTDDMTLPEPTDWLQASCVLSANAAQSLSATACSKPATAGATAAAAADHVHLAGKTDGTAAGTHAATYVSPTRAVDATDAASPYQLVYQGANNNNELGRTGVQVVFSESAHDENNGGNTTQASNVGIFDAAIEPPPGTTQFSLIKQGTPDVVLYTRASDQRPAVSSVSAATSGAPVRYVGTLSADPDFPSPTQTALSEDGSLIAWEAGSGVRIRRANDRSSTPLFLPDVRDPSFAHTRNSLVYTSADGGNVEIVDLDTAGQVPAVLGTPRRVYTSSRDEFGMVDAPVEGPAFSPSDDRIVLASQGGSTAQLYILSASGTCTLLGAAGCTQLTDNGYAHSPSWGRSPNPAAVDGIIAFTDDYAYDGGSSSAVAVTDVLTGGPVSLATATPESTPMGLPQSDRTVIKSLAGSPDWGGGRLSWTEFDETTAVSAVVTVEGLRFQDKRTVEESIGEPSLSGDDNLIAYSVDEPAPADTAIYLKNLAPPTGERVINATDDKGRDLRLDVVAVCPTATYPLMTDVAPTVSSSGSAQFQVDIQTAQLCPNAVLRYDVTDGFQIAAPVTETVQGTGSSAAVAVTSPRSGDSFLQYRSVPLAANGRDADGAPVAVSYTITGPGGTNRSGTVAAGDRTDLAPFTTPGAYTLTASAGGRSTTASFTVLEDKDADGIPASLDSRSANPCFPLNADNDPRTAVADYDGDFLFGADDTSPCTSVHNTTVDLDANTLNGGSAGSKISFFVTSSSVSLSQFSAANIAITRIAGHYVNFPALSWAVDSRGVWMAKFDRQAFQNTVAALGLKGFVPVLVQGKTANAAFSGIDPNDPTIK
ncbi:MAG: hypothetical protein JJD92_16735 [Frankiaceae bacterium]|nr:hypothetical protein [Frankiaceae bacterium]